MNAPAVPSSLAVGANPQTPLEKIKRTGSQPVIETTTVAPTGGIRRMGPANRLVSTPKPKTKTKSKKNQKKRTMKKEKKGTTQKSRTRKPVRKTKQNKKRHQKTQTLSKPKKQYDGKRVIKTGLKTKANVAVKQQQHRGKAGAKPVDKIEKAPVETPAVAKPAGTAPIPAPSVAPPKEQPGMAAPVATPVRSIQPPLLSPPSVPSWLNRADTMELKDVQSPQPPTAGPETAATKPAPKGRDKAQHARRMRFYRSLDSLSLMNSFIVESGQPLKHYFF